MDKIITQEQINIIVQKATSISRIMALMMVSNYVIMATKIAWDTGEITPMPWENVVATVMFYAVGQFTEGVLNLIRDITPWGKVKTSVTPEGKQ